MRSEQLAFTWCPRAGFGFLEQSPCTEQWVGKGQLTCLQMLGRMSARNLLIQPGGPKMEVWGTKLPKQNCELYRRRNKKCSREREKKGGWGWGPLKMIQGSQTDHWPSIAHWSSPNPELTHCFLLCIGVFLEVLFGEPGEIMKKKRENQPPCFRKALLPSTCIHHIMVFSARHPTMPLITLLRTSKMGKYSIVRLDPQEEIPCNQTINELISTYREVSSALPLNWEALPPMIWRKHQRHVYQMSRW